MADHREIMPESQLPRTPSLLFFAAHTCTLRTVARMTSPDSSHDIVGEIDDDTTNSRDHCDHVHVNNPVVADLADGRVGEDITQNASFSTDMLRKHSPPT